MRDENAGFMAGLIVASVAWGGFTLFSWMRRRDVEQAAEAAARGEPLGRPMFAPVHYNYGPRFDVNERSAYTPSRAAVSWRHRQSSAWR